MCEERGDIQDTPADTCIKNSVEILDRRGWLVCLLSGGIRSLARGLVDVAIL